MVCIGANALPVALADAGGLGAGSAYEAAVGVNEVLGVIIIYASINGGWQDTVSVGKLYHLVESVDIIVISHLLGDLLFVHLLEEILEMSQ